MENVKITSHLEWGQNFEASLEGPNDLKLCLDGSFPWLDIFFQKNDHSNACT